VRVQVIILSCFRQPMAKNYGQWSSLARVGTCA
jgi:hypothetical protein